MRRLFRPEAFTEFQKKVEMVLKGCGEYRLKPTLLLADHNLMIETFGNSADTVFAGLPVRALPLEYGRDHIMVMKCDSGYIGLYLDGRTEKADRPLG